MDTVLHMSAVESNDMLEVPEMLPTPDPDADPVNVIFEEPSSICFDVNVTDEEPVSAPVASGRACWMNMMYDEPTPYAMGAPVAEDENVIELDPDMFAMLPIVALGTLNDRLEEPEIDPVAPIDEGPAEKDIVVKPRTNPDPRATAEQLSIPCDVPHNWK